MSPGHPLSQKEKTPSEATGQVSYQLKKAPSAKAGMENPTDRGKPGGPQSQVAKVGHD